MSYFIENEIQKFTSSPARLRNLGFRTEELAEFAFLVKPKAGEVVAKGEFAAKPIALGVMGIIHGSEVVGSAVLNVVLDYLERGLLQLEVPVAFILGNPWAAREQKRFLQSDLNRSFSRLSHETKEEKRAKALQPVLDKLYFLLDLHQTNLRSREPFFIFPFSAKGFCFARHIHTQTPIVTHWGESFSKDGKCSDEYVNSQGGVGITLELGKVGFQSYQIAAGVWGVLSAIAAVTRMYKIGKMSVPEGLDGGDVYTFSEVYPYPLAPNEVKLLPGWYNFKKVRAGEQLGVINREPIMAKDNGRILFPAYPREGISVRPAELFRIIHKISQADLPVQHWNL